MIFAEALIENIIEFTGQTTTLAMG